MLHRRTLAFSAALLVMVGGLAACAEPAAEDAPAVDGSTAPALAVATEMTPAEPVAIATEVTPPEDRVADANGCRPSSQEVLDSLMTETAAAGATIGASASQLLDVDEMIYGTWEVNAVEVTTTNGQEVALWVTKVLPPGQWSSSASKESLGFSMNAVAAEVSSFGMPTEKDFGRLLSADDPDAMAAMACLP